MRAIASARPEQTQSLSFQNTQFDVVDRDGQRWLGSPQIADALGYSRADRICELYARNAAEFFEPRFKRGRCADFNHEKTVIHGCQTVNHGSQSADRHSLTVRRTVAYTSRIAETAATGIGVSDYGATESRSAVPSGFFALVRPLWAATVGEPKGSPVALYRYANPALAVHPRLASVVAVFTPHREAAMRANTLARPEQTQSLSFQNTQFDVVDRDGQRWLRLPQIGVALGYANPHKVQQVFERNAAEFTDSMTAVVTLLTAGGEQQVRIFSLRGAHLLGTLARTSKAVESSDSPWGRIDSTRWLIDFGHQGQQQVHSVDKDAVVIAPDALVRLVAKPGVVAARLLPELIASAASRLQEIDRVRHSYSCVPVRTGGAA